MSRKTRRAAALLMSMILTMGMLAGCGVNKKKDDEEDISTRSDSTDSEEHEPLTMYTAQLNYTYFLDALHEKYPEINIKLISYKGSNTSGFMKYQLENGDIPDIYTSNHMQDETLQEEYLLDLSAYDFVNEYSDTMLDSMDVEGGIYMLPSRYQVAGINYNKTMFEEHGWRVPESFEELQELVEEIREEEPDVTPVVARMSLKGYPFQYMWALGSTDFNGTPAGIQWKQDFLDGTDTAVGNLEGVAEYFKKWVDAGYISDTGLDDSEIMDEFYDGRIAMVLGTGTSKWSGVGKTTGEEVEVGIMAWPGENGNHGMLLSNVSRYYGLNKELAEPGNEQKLEDALKVMEFISTEEGQDLLATGNQNVDASPFKNFDITEDNPLYEVKDYIEDGYTIPVAYEGWVDGLLVPMADEIINLIDRNISVEEMLERFDEINEQLQEDPELYDFAELDEPLTQEQAARLSGMALIDYTGADVSLISLGGITEDGNNLENETGVQCGLYKGGIDEEIINVFRPNSNHIAMVDLTGARIKAMYEEGRLLVADPEDLDAEYDYLEEAVSYSMPYVLVVKDDAELDDDTVYTVAFAEDDYADAYADEWGDELYILKDGSPREAIESWLEALPEEHFDSSALEW